MVDNIGKRNPGRPKGTGRHQKQKLDEMVLEKLADRKLADPSAKTAVIIKQLIDRTKDTGGLRRLERGFEKNKPALMQLSASRQTAPEPEQFVRSRIRRCSHRRHKRGSVLAVPQRVSILRGGAASPCPRHIEHGSDVSGTALRAPKQQP
jgi:hypothetical protein